jgi:DHA1 family bicyclomycin/chloramphenicol resistance-like MFS transporter
LSKCAGHPAHLLVVATESRNMQQRTEPTPVGIHLPISRYEFIALAAALMATNALAIDIMLPGLQQIGASLDVAVENHRQYVISAYIAGFGLAQLAWGPVSDRFGRRGPLLVGLVIYVVAALAAALAPSFASLLALRTVQGVGAAATRVIAVSIVRDVYGGRRMAETMSLVMMVFMIVPVVAPGIGQLLMLFSEWHMIFVFMGVTALAITAWIALRLPETLPVERRRPFTVQVIGEGFRFVVTNRMSLCYTLAVTAVFAGLFGFINSAQQIFVGIYDLGVWFPVLFAVIAGMMAVSSFTNARLVGRVGMRRLSHGALLGFFCVNAILLALSLAGPIPLPLYVVLFAAAMIQFGWIGANFNALAMEPLGHLAGTASSAQGFTQTLGGGLVGAAIGQAFDGTVVPLAAGFCALSVIALTMVLIAEKGRLFRVVNEPH